MFDGRNELVELEETKCENLSLSSIFTHSDWKNVYWKLAYA